MRLKTIALSFALTVSAGCTVAIAADDTHEVQVLLLGGQSNMAGRGTFADLDDASKERIIKASAKISRV